QLLQLALKADLDGIDGNVRLGEDSGRQPLFLVEEREQEVLNIDLLVAETDGKALCGSERLLGFFGEAIDVHGFPRIPLAPGLPARKAGPGAPGMSSGGIICVRLLGAPG